MARPKGGVSRSVVALGIVVVAAAACIQPPDDDFRWSPHAVPDADGILGAVDAVGQGADTSGLADAGAGEDKGDETARGHWVEHVFRSEGAAAVDIAILADLSGSMDAERPWLPERLAGLIAELASPGDGDGDGWPDRAPVASIHVGIASADMGTGGFHLNTCGNSDVGYDGCFLRRSDGREGCGTDLPAFLSFSGAQELATAAERFEEFHSCVALPREQQCGFEQQLKSIVRAVGDQAAEGGCNEGFLRPDAALILLVVTDENDGSVRPDHTEIFDERRSDLGHLNIRCFLNPDCLEDVAGYAVDILALKPPARRNLISVGLITGVPPDAPLCAGSGETLDRCLDVAMMEEQINPIDPTGLIPACNTSTGMAYPGRRLVELAQLLGPNAWVDSVCDADWTDTFRALADRVRAGLDLPESTGCVDDLDVPFDAGSCRADCSLVETLEDDRPCALDASCPAAWCPPPPPDLENIDRLEPCRDPWTHGECVPLERNLGLAADETGRRHRQCLVRQAPRDPFAWRCGEPLADGWTFVPAGWSSPVCDEVRLAASVSGAPLIAPGSSATLRCRAR
ncbi:MAG: hypothetical protein HY905_25090 [Deltaproteobacteria bacterium]|nr:hypothetical protein [Deltaproteobacteria bacterium]